MISRTFRLSARLASAAAVIAIGAGLAPGGVQAATQSGPARVVGAMPAPPNKPGPGVVFAWDKKTGKMARADFGKAASLSGNSFRVALSPDDNRIYVPTPVGMTYILNTQTMQQTGAFKSLPGGRVAALAPGEKLLIVLSGKGLAGYRTTTNQQVYSLDVGGNAIAFTPDGTRAFVGGNMSNKVTEVDLATGVALRSFDIARSGDLAFVDGRLFSADMKTGVLSVLDPELGKITRIKTPEVDPGVSYKAIAKAKAGFMEMAADPAAHRLYVAGFSGNILRFDTQKPAYLGQIAVNAVKGKPNKLSGIALVDQGKQALVTVENQDMTVLVRLSDGKIVKQMPGIASNRWIGSAQAMG